MSSNDGHGYRGGAGFRGGSGRGRGEYFKNKYGNKRGRSMEGSGAGRFPGPHPVQPVGAAESNPAVGSATSTGSHEDLRALLQRLDRAQYGAYKRLTGNTYRFPTFDLTFQYVQSDAYAPPSALRVLVPHTSAFFPPALYSTRTRRIALADFFEPPLCRIAARDQRADPTRSSVRVTDEGIDARFALSLPARGRSIMGVECAALVVDTLPGVVAANLTAAGVDVGAAQAHVECVEDQDALRRMVEDAGLVAFIGNGSILPRAAGDSQLPLTSAIPWQSPPSLEITFTLPNRGAITGTALRAGVTLIVGGGFHGKSTLLDALTVGIYNKRPGDGREFVVSHSRATQVQSEDGRAVHNVDISPFIGTLPMRAPDATTEFSTTNASGSTSLAAAVQEALEQNAPVLLLDEDTCATNFMARDARMRQLVPADPITPLTHKIRALAEDRGVSLVLVVGGAGEFLGVADTVLAMDGYIPRDVTNQARAIAAGSDVPDERPYGHVAARRVVRVPPIDREKVHVRQVRRAQIGELEVQVDAAAGLVEKGQLRYAIAVLAWIGRNAAIQKLPLSEAVARAVAAPMEEVVPRLEGWQVVPRAEEVAMVVNRVRSVAMAQVEDE
ncbi:ABC transporter ATPase [Allomyces macrogynus ATCC 38327]|uniref:ABC transporter ATPase n=1 Tax=Allomyces macrogynus (strain ATCC 38327) TaxID=578462 RepID=A0A0L0T657_ALLM3|nr:ABC transporter ATPase [Allomyces macrogynus ATCC 38327]|eukprot:KNE70019.1 ABC transporter ATPase [Allomyces macrogynus ATCC 38327]